MSKTVHSVKLQAYDSVDLDRLSYSNGDLVYDLTSGTIRLMNGVTSGGTKLATQTWTTTVLSAYVTNSNLNTALAGYATTSSLSAYATTSSLSAYATTASLSTYATTASLSTYITSDSLSTTLAGYVTSSGLSTALAGYATTTSDNLKAPKADPTFTGTATIPKAIIGGVNIKSFSIAMGAALA
jgi:hypothetical protein